MVIAPPLYILLFAYLAFLGVFVVFIFIHIYHIFMSASFTIISFVASFFIFILTILTLYGTGYLLQDTDWNQPLFTISTGGTSQTVQPFTQ